MYDFDDSVKFQFHKVRLEANTKLDVGGDITCFNSIRYD